MKKCVFLKHENITKIATMGWKYEIFKKLVKTTWQQKEIEVKIAWKHTKNTKVSAWKHEKMTRKMKIVWKYKDIN